MVTNAGTFGRTGVHDFVLVRASAIVMTLYVFFLVGFLVVTPDLTFATWKGFFGHLGVKVFTLLTLVSLLVHAWIGLWQVLTDYVKPTGLRMGLQFVLNLAAMAYVISGFVILWGV
ncbi:succinate dehydrogenase, hydrophobic membrane anchor protein [Gallaecimonas kandeliae]|uniref:succinate dehydrogenase, hydrophobic membrane anchor protein n=1 Tax=Gallaecimonas kandeliae TaxID=3029055 RepID=UPI002648460E|nr:succinate dehydrogenase, hydrophobic membrane anchor protein [Gallaecimonas kandeliae]WKE67068.1 succinate dehydrogenase, hydrophobic membrane anchor protein [Gallaecimonas kandeliae]